VLFKQFLGGKVFCGGMKEKNGLSQTVGLFFYSLEQHSAYTQALRTRLHGNGKEFASVLFLMPLEQVPHHGKSDWSALLDCDESDGGTRFKPLRNETPVRAVHIENFSAELTDETDVRQVGSTNHKPCFGHEGESSVPGLLAGRPRAGPPFPEAVDSLDIAVFSETPAIAHDSISFKEESCKARKAIQTCRLEGIYKFLQYLP
jgi:hypothetical protein